VPCRGRALALGIGWGVWRRGGGEEGGELAIVVSIAMLVVILSGLDVPVVDWASVLVLFF